MNVGQQIKTTLSSYSEEVPLLKDQPPFHKRPLFSMNNIYNSREENVSIKQYQFSTHWI